MKNQNRLSLVFKYSRLLITREWKRYLLPFVSLAFTGAIVMTVLLITLSASTYLNDRNKELVGGDVTIESNFIVDNSTSENVIGVGNTRSSSTAFTFPSIIGSGDANVPVSVQVVDNSYPLYGETLITNGKYRALELNEIYIDTATSQKIGRTAGENITFSNKEYTIVGIIERDPRQLLSGFSFLPKVIISKKGFDNSGLNASLVRAEYRTSFLINDDRLFSKESIVERALTKDLNVDVVGVTRTGFIEGLSAVEQFLVLAVLLVCILAAVNMYAGVMYLLSVLRKSFAILLSLGLSKKNLALILSLSFGYIILSAILVGGLVSVYIVSTVLEITKTKFDIVLPSPSLVMPSLLTALVLISVSVASFIPSLRTLLALTPKELLSGQEKTNQSQVVTTLFFVTISTLLPLAFIASVLLKDILLGLASIGVLTLIYVFVAILFYLGLSIIYKARSKFSFTLRTIISFKKNDGVFGIVSLTSLYIALASLSVLILLQATLLSFLNRDLSQRLPSLYVIDVQKSQVETIKEKYPELTLFPNIGARIVSIDGLDIQDGLARNDESIDRELGREYNLTYRTQLLSSEKVSKGQWLQNKKGEVSVDSGFADRAGISMGSKIILSIQGFTVEATVTSIRESDSRSGLPFFFFVFNPSDLEQYPSTFFGYGNYNQDAKAGILKYLASTFPNVSVIDTREVAEFARTIIGGLTVIVFIISLPPLVLALFLIVTLVISSFGSRRKASAQLLALGAATYFTKKLYYLETLFSTLVASLLGYITGVVVTYIVTKYYLKLPAADFFDRELFVALGIILGLVVATAYLLWKSDRRSVREILSYEEH